MQLTKSWEKTSTIRNRPQRILALEEGKYFFPPVEQPLCLHPLVISLGEQTKHYILTQAAYIFMKNMVLLETDVICDISTKIARGKSPIKFPDEICQSLLTVIIDETYHAYVANDFIYQLSVATGIKPLEVTQTSSLSRAIQLSTRGLSPQRKAFFEMIAVCIAENSITSELIQFTQNAEVNPFFSEVNSDHRSDEARHAAIFTRILTYLWLEIPDVDKAVLRSLVPQFIHEYLSNELKIQNGRTILNQLDLTPQEIETILYETYPEYPLDNEEMLGTHPVAVNIMLFLKRCGILTDDTPNSSKDHWTSVAKNLNPWNLNFLRGPKELFQEAKLLRKKIISLNTEFSGIECCGLLLSYIHSVTQENELAFISGSTPVVSQFNGDEPMDEFIRKFVNKCNISKKMGGDFSEFIQGADPSLSEWMRGLPLVIELSEEICRADQMDDQLVFHINKNSLDNLNLSVSFHSTYYAEARVSALLDNFTFYLQIAEKNKSICISKLPLVNQRQRQDLLVQGLQSNRAWSPTTITDLFAKHVLASPRADALVDLHKVFTYEELDDLSNHVARNLIQRDLGRGAVVAVIQERGYAYIPLVLGIMKAGMIFLSLPEDGPESRLRKILDDAQTSLLILDKPAQHRDLCQTRPWISADALLSSSSTNLDISKLEAFKARPGDIACILYTSGSTGIPKGVQIKHSALAYFARAATSTFPITNTDRLLQFSVHSFDASLAEICNALSSGACLVMRTESMLDSSAQFFTECERLQITVLNLPTPLWAQLVKDAKAFSLMLPKMLKTVLIYGEKVLPDSLADWYEITGDKIKLVNTYGPTETTIAASVCDLGKYPKLRTTESLIGQSLGHTHLFVLDHFHRLLPIGAAGELYIGGPGVSPGYIRDLQLTKLRFFEQLGLPEEGLTRAGLLYKTGDKVRWLESENNLDQKVLAFIGRDDRQVKIRGYRVELGEVEHVLNSCPGVQSSVVICYSQGDQQILAAFIEPQSTQLLNLSEVQTYIQGNLPSYMQPTRIKILDAWPLTIRGKVDKNQLIAMLSRSDSNQHFMDPIEAKLAALWQELLEAKDVRPGAHFFQLGGHSLIAMRLLHRINSEFQTKLTLRHVLEKPQIEQMAELIKQDCKKASQQSAILTEKSLRTDEPSPLSFAQESLWLADRLHGGKSIHYNVAYALSFKTIIDKNHLERALNYLLNRHEILRSVFRESKSAITQVAVDFSLKLQIEVVSEAEYRTKSLEETRTPFNLTTQPPIRIRLFQLKETMQTILLVHHHHIIHDGQSIVIFLNELKACYEAFASDRTPSLPAITMQYADFAKLQRNSDTADHEAMTYWQEKLEGYRPLILAFRNNSGRTIPSKGDHFQFSIEGDLAKALRKVCCQRDSSIFSGLLSILTILFHRYTGMTDIAVGSTFATRTHQDQEQLIGMFTNMVILRNQINPGETFSSLLNQVKETILDAMQYCNVPINHIVKKTKLARMPNDFSLFDVVVSFHNFEKGLTKLVSKSFESDVNFIDSKTAKFGITFDIYDVGDSFTFRIEYCTELYDQERIKDIAGDIRDLVEDVIVAEVHHHKILLK